MHVQMIFRLKMKLRSQVRWHVPACGGYHHMPDPAPLDAKLLTLLLPSPIALEVHLTHPDCRALKSANAVDRFLTMLQGPASIHHS